MNVNGEIKVQTMSGEVKYLGDVGPQGPEGPSGPPGRTGTTDYNLLQNKPETLTNIEIENLFERVVL